MNIFWIIIVMLIFIVVLLKYFEKKLYINKKMSEMSADLEGKERYFMVLRENETVYILRLIMKNMLLGTSYMHIISFKITP